MPNASLKRAACAFLVVVFWASGKSATAQDRALDIERFSPALDDAGFISLDGTRGPPPLQFSFGFFTDLSFNPVELELDRDAYVPVERRVGAHLAAEVGVTGRLSAAVRLPLVVYQEGERLPEPADSKLTSFALRDPQISLRYRFWGVSQVDHNAPKDGPGLALQLGASLPIGTADAFATDDAARIEAALLGDFQLLGAGAGASVGFRHRFGDAVGGGLPERNEFTFAAGLKLPLPPLPILIPIIEVRGAADFKSKIGTALELGLGATLKLGDVTLALSGSVGVTRGIGTPDGRVVLGLRWAPTASDQDGDGKNDGDDQCPFLAEDADGFTDDDGCPDPDNDNDLIPDLDDRCPSDAAEEGRDEDEDGCTDPAPK